ncbi:MAG: glycogen debranching protein GlgX [Rhizobiaceae bacterium]|nr:glycogen debranching protein GlgX [Rhizobiaceae bacterium]
MSDGNGDREAHPLGAHAVAGGVLFGVWSAAAEAVWVSVFDEDGQEEAGRFRLTRGEGDVHSGFVAGLEPGARYGLRADGENDPDRGLWFDPAKLLMDPYAVAIDRPYVYDSRLGNPREDGFDTAPLMPKAVVSQKLEPLPARPALWRPGGFVYELSVRSFTKLHPEVEPEKRGTIGALGHPAVLEHLKKLGVDAVELMPVTAWMDERHLPPLGLTNAWGYNPVSFMALDPRLAPGGLAELRETVAALHEAGIGVVLDLVFNHTAESDRYGPTLSLRGLDNGAYYRHAADGGLANDTGTGNTIDCAQPAVQRLVLDSLRHFVRHAGVDGFRFDLAPVLGRTGRGFEADRGLIGAMATDPLLADRVLIAEPWDIGPGGYQLGQFPPPFLEWNDRFRDDIRRFWRGDTGTVGALATRLAGSSDVFPNGTTRSVNFVAAHDGMTLRDMVSYGRKHNLANGEDNRDGHDENLSWNNGDEGDSGDAAVRAARGRDMRALLATLFSSRGAVMLTAGDEFGRTQLGNNNAYAQDNEITWLDWEGRDRELEAFVGGLAALRRQYPVLTDTRLLADGDVAWLRPDGRSMEVADWEASDSRALAMVLAGEGTLAVLVNGGADELVFMLPGESWELKAASATARPLDGGPIAVAGRSVTILGRSGA